MMKDSLNVYDRQRAQSLEVRGTTQPLSRNFIYQAHLADRQRFVPLSTLQLENSNYNRFPAFRELVTAITEFNKRLQSWQQGGQPIDKLLVTYNQFTNLSQRLMALRFNTTEEAVLAELEAIRRWFAQARATDAEKQMGNLAPLIQILKNLQAQPPVDDKDNVPMYKQMSRTQHGQFKPPRERLRDFKRKELITPSTDVDNMMTTKQTFFSEKAMSIDMRTNRNSLTGQTIQGLPLIITTEKKSQAEVLPNTATNDKQPQPQNQQEAPLINDPFDDPGIEQEEEEEQQNTEQFKKPYTSDAIHKKPQQRSQLRTADVPTLSGQRRLLLSQQHDYYKVIEERKDLDTVKKWSKTKSREATQLMRRAQAARLGNKFQQCRYEPQRQNKSEKTMRRKRLLDESDEESKEPEIVSLTKHATSSGIKHGTAKIIEANVKPFVMQPSNPIAFLQRARQIEKEIKETRLTKTINTFSKYIRHTSESLSHRRPLNEQQDTVLRQQTLTTLPRHRSNSFGQLLHRHHAERYNDETHGMIQKIKIALSSKGLALPIRTLSNSLRVPMEAHYSYTDKLYKQGERLISNPWFPKNLGMSKKKKKK